MISASDPSPGVTDWIVNGKGTWRVIRPAYTYLTPRVTGGTLESFGKYTWYVWVGDKIQSRGDCADHAEGQRIADEVAAGWLAVHAD